VPEAVELLTTPVAARPARLRTAGVAGLGTALPERVVPNAPIAERLGVDDTWIERRTGIASRRHVTTERLSDLAADAARAALDDAGLDAGAVDLVLVATTTSDELLPNAAPLVAHALGTTAAAADVGAACTGFLSALALAAAYVEAGRADHVLVVGADTLSRFLDPGDRRTAGLFGDGAGAVVLSAGAGELSPVVLRSAGQYADAIVIPREPAVVHMDGHETFVVAVSSLAEATLDACRAAGIDAGDVDLFVYHQANRRILDAVAERLGLDHDRVVDAIGTLGNTSAASIPLALAAARPAPGSRVLLAAAGAGFTYGAAILDWRRA
jgi:3-oxoacyl-[acyl-carrier-protein] synthase III